MARLMSVSHTQEAVATRTKTETRRSGWTFLHVGDRLTLTPKGMGLKKGERAVRLCDVEVTHVHRERLEEITPDAVAREGFPDWTPERFIAFFRRAMGGPADQEVTVIRWRYLS